MPKKANHNYKQRNEYTVVTQRKLERERIQRLGAQKIGDDIVADDFFDKRWFKDLQQDIFNEIKRLKKCTIGDLVRGKFAETDRYHFAEALQSLGERIERHEGLITRFSIK